MMNDFLKRLLLSAAYLIGAMCLIHLVMGTGPGFGGHWLFIYTGKIVWLIALILKITFFVIIVAGIFYFLNAAVQAHDSWQEHKAEEAMKKTNEEVAKCNAAQQAIVASAREFEAVAEKKRKEKEFEEHQRKRQLEKNGPRSEEDALAKAMDSLKFGGLE
jgi:uncharacterized membrane protein